MSQQALSARERSSLVEAVLDLDGMSDRRTRDIFLDLLRREVGYPLMIQRHELDRLDVSLTVDGCLAHPGALHVFIGILHNNYKESFAMTRLERLVDELLPQPLFDPELYGRLYRVLADISIPAEALYAMYRDAVGQFGPRLASVPDSVFAVVQHLAELSAGPDRIPPLLRFLELVAASIEGDGAVAVRKVVDGVAAHRANYRRELHQLRGAASKRVASPRRRSYVVVQLQEDGASADRYLVSVWLQQEDQRVSEPLYRDDEPHPLHQIPELLDELLSTTPEIAIAAGEGFSIEFILPRHLLNHPIDQWSAVREGMPHSLGTEHPIVVRSLERLLNRRTHYDWRRKWEWLQAHGHVADDGAIRWIRHPGQTGPKALHAEFLLDDKPVCLILAFTPQAERDLEPDEITAALHAGLPVILWARDGRPSKEFEAEVQALLGKWNLHELRDLVLWLRRQAESTERTAMPQPLGRALTLLWDDPDRIPEPFIRLRAPA